MKTLSQLAGGRKCFPRVHVIPRNGFLCYRNKLLIGKNVLNIMAPILINKDMFEHSYNKKQRHYLPTKDHLVKAMVFPVVMYGFESWT